MKAVPLLRPLRGVAGNWVVLSLPSPFCRRPVEALSSGCIEVATDKRRTDVSAAQIGAEPALLRIGALPPPCLMKFLKSVIPPATNSFLQLMPNVRFLLTGRLNGGLPY